MALTATASTIRELIENKDFATLKTTIREVEIHELADLLGDLVEEDLALVFRLLPRQEAADVFGDLPFQQQEDLLEALSSENVIAILNDMPPDERTQLLEELPGELAQKLVAFLSAVKCSVKLSFLVAL